jgi:hypothetical protein
VWRLAAALLLLWPPTPPSAGEPASAYRECVRKFDLVRQERLPPGARILLTPSELNAYVRFKAKEKAPHGFRDPRVALSPGRATGSAQVDFLKLSQDLERPVGWLARLLLSGERPVKVTAHIRSAGGRATVNVERVEVSGFEVKGAALDFLVRNFLLPRFPDA